ncbi:hypothetical protein BJ508DRAFT_334221 [Ascobolus immersus RN42]|uniref:Uncharacterized protein n=1 Tax=Ascobolus immersus RN42 TaxID=1160509 RepID=A0A3N4HGT6_ASCIM|nr:hypothetical protein BJ508DRAFT_334221 [Ascobolus immersus RN42]
MAKDSDDADNLEKLDGTNYRQCTKVWKLYFQSKGLYKYLDPGTPRPTIEINPLAALEVPPPVEDDEENPQALVRDGVNGAAAPVETAAERAAKLIRNAKRAGLRRDRQAIIDARAANQYPTPVQIAAIETWDKDTAKIMVVLYSNIKKSLRGDFESCLTPAEIWSKMQLIYGQTSLQNKLSQKKILESLQFHEGDDANKFFSRMVESEEENTKKAHYASSKKGSKRKDYDKQSKPSKHVKPNNKDWFCYRCHEKEHRAFECKNKRMTDSDDES